MAARRRGCLSRSTRSISGHLLNLANPALTGRGLSVATFRRGSPGNTFATFPTRTFSFLVDPTALPELGVPKNIGALFLIRDLGALEWPVDVKLLWPTYIDHVPPAGVSEPLATLLATSRCKSERGSDTPAGGTWSMNVGQ